MTPGVVKTTVISSWRSSNNGHQDPKLGKQGADFHLLECCWAGAAGLGVGADRLGAGAAAGDFAAQVCARDGHVLAGRDVADPGRVVVLHAMRRQCLGMLPSVMRA